MAHLLYYTEISPYTLNAEDSSFTFCFHMYFGVLNMIWLCPGKEKLHFSVCQNAEFAGGE